MRVIVLGMAMGNTDQSAVLTANRAMRSDIAARRAASAHGSGRAARWRPKRRAGSSAVSAQSVTIVRRPSA